MSPKILSRYYNVIFYVTMAIITENYIKFGF